MGKYRKPRDLSGLMLSAIRLGVITLKARSIEGRRLQSATPLSGARATVSAESLVPSLSIDCASAPVDHQLRKYFVSGAQADKG